MTWDIFSGEPLNSTTSQSRWWTSSPARDWHEQSAAKADAIASIERELVTEQRPLARHSLLVRLAALTGVPAPEYVPPPEPEPEPPKQDWRDENVRRAAAHAAHKRNLLSRK